MSLLTRLLRRRRTEPNVDEIARHSGLADVDPQPLTQTAGEGIVEGSDEEARSIAEQRDRLPTSRGN